MTTDNIGRRLDANGKPVVCETVDGMPLCFVFEQKATGIEPNPDDWETVDDPEARVPGPYPLPITCPDCLEVMHA